jgi:glycosyltransferase involved in cell wall biosynthesis
MISCLCITRGDRPALLSEAVSDFVRQTFSDRELLILHDGDQAVHAGVSEIAAAHAGASIRIERVAPGPRLGELRNIAIARACGEWICQWDDNDGVDDARTASGSMKSRAKMVVVGATV